MDVVAETSAFSASMVFYPLLGILVFLAGIHFWIESQRIIKLGKKLPGPPPLPIIGNALITNGVDPKDLINELLKYDVYGNVVRVLFGHKLLVFLTDPRDVELILGSSVHLDKSPEYKYFKSWLGDGLLLSTGDKWRAHRKIIAPSFHMNILKSFVPLFYDNSKSLVEKLKSEVGKEFDCLDYFSAVTVDILLETAMGTKTVKDDTIGYDYAMAVMKVCDIIHRRTYNLLLRLDSYFQFTNFAKRQDKLITTIHNLSKRAIHEKQTTYVKRDFEAEKNEVDESTKNYQNIHYVRDDLDEIDENNVGEKRRLAFLDMLIEYSKNSKLTYEEVKEEVDTIMFEGHDTTSSGSSFILSVLGAHKDVQARVHEELDEIFKDSDRPCTFQDTVEMKYLERVILETLRLFPPVPAIARQVNEDVQLASSDGIVPAGATVVILPWKTHRLEEYYPNPLEFNPDNFLPENMQKRHYYSFIPFSAGPRSCVGRKFAMLKLKVLMSTILRSYSVHSDKSHKDFALTGDIILKRSDGFKVKVEPRKSNVVS